MVVVENCGSGSITNFEWTSNAATALPVQTVYLDNTLVSESFTAISSLAHCTFNYDFLIDDGTGNYVTYSDVHIVLDSVL